MRGLKDKVIILTGAAGGLGQAIATRLIQEQAYPVLVDHNQDTLLKLTENQVFNDLLCLNGNITDPDFITTIMSDVIKKYGKIDGASARKIDSEVAPISTSLGVLGMPGLTAYFGFLDVCSPKPGDTVVVSASSGAVGAIVGQIAKIMGCKVIGIAGSDVKTDYCLYELGFDNVINYKTDNILTKISEYAPSGVDIYFDNVGGEISDNVISNLSIGARIAICGQISLYNLEENEKGDRVGSTLLINQASMTGFLVFQFKSRYQEGLSKLSQWLLDEKIKYKEDIVSGIENAPDTFIGMMKGKNFGKLLIKII